MKRSGSSSTISLRKATATTIYQEAGLIYIRCNAQVEEKGNNQTEIRERRYQEEKENE
jgi:hypothetical protein